LRRPSTRPDLLPRSIAANASQKCMDADCDCQKDKSDQADGSEKNGEDSCVAAGDYQHSGVSVSVAGAPRNITDRSYLGADALLSVRPDVTLSIFRIPGGYPEVN
jgi:hypothetical protein